MRFRFRPAGFYCNSAFHRFRPTLPPAKQANRNLILKAISEAQDSITKTTAFPSSTFTNIQSTAAVVPLALPPHLRLSHSAAEADGSRCASCTPGQQRGDERSHPAGAGAPPQPGTPGSSLPPNRATSLWSTWCVTVNITFFFFKNGEMGALVRRVAAECGKIGYACLEGADKCIQ